MLVNVTASNAEIIHLLNELQRGYTERNMKKIDQFMDSLFVDADDCNIIGTSITEWCIGYKEVKELFTGDWEYWGDLKLDIDSAVVKISGNTAFAYLPGTVKYSFDHKQETDERYLGYMVSDLSDERLKENAKLKAIRLQEVNFVLSHYLHQRDKQVRDYYWHVGVSLILAKAECNWKIKHIHYAMPVDSIYPDVRLSEYTNSDYIKMFAQETENIKSAVKAHPLRVELTECINEFCRGVLDKNVSCESIAKECFNPDSFLIDTDNKSYNGSREISAVITEYRKHYDSLTLNSEAMLIDSKENNVWIALNGNLRTTLTADEAIDKAYQNIDKITKSQDPAREKLFKIRREIASVSMQNSYGDEYLFPIRISALLTKNDNAYRFSSFHLSFPFDLILEEKTDLCE